MQKYLLGIDLGTSSLKAVLFDVELNSIASSVMSYPSLYPREGWVEQDATVWWSAVIQAMKEILEKSRINPADIAGIGIDSQSSVALPLDINGHPLRPGPLWMDRRSDRQCEWIEKVDPHGFWDITANRNDPSNFGPKVLWIKDNEPELYKKTEMFLHANGYLIYKLTGEFSMDISEAALTQLCNARESCWSEEILKALGIDREKLPEIYGCTDIISGVNRQASQITGLTEGTPVVAGLVDAAASGVGSGINRPGQIYVTAGTVQGAGLSLEKPYFNKLLHTFHYVLHKTWVVMGAVDFSGGILRWFNKLLGNKDYSEITRLANSSKAGHKFLLFIPYMVGQRSPLWNSNTRGVIFGLDPTTNKQDLIRMIMEGCSYGMRYIFDIFEKSDIHTKRVIMTGGSTRIKMWNQILADIIGKIVDIPKNMDVAPLGSAITAGLGVGIYKDLKEISHRLKVSQTYIPEEKNRKLYDRMYAVYCSLFNNIQQQYDMLAEVKQQFSCT
jgi:xylulokinase